MQVDSDKLLNQQDLSKDKGLNSRFKITGNLIDMYA